MKRLLLPGLLCLGCLLAATPSRGDAIVRTQAMLASTIAEFYVEPEQIRLELEIGLADLPAFRSLVPDEIYQKLGHPPRPWPERIREFFERDLVLLADAILPEIGHSFDEALGHPQQLELL